MKDEFRSEVRSNHKKNRLMPDTEIPATEMVFREKLTGRAEAVYLSH